MEERALDELKRAGTLLTRDLNFKSLISILVEQTLDITKSDLACLYLPRDTENPKSDLNLCYKRGRFEVPPRFPAGSQLISFIRESEEAVLLLDRKKSCFIEILLHPRMRSGIALPVSTTKAIERFFGV